jgi:hypothetical protein
VASPALCEKDPEKAQAINEVRSRYLAKESYYVEAKLMMENAGILPVYWLFTLLIAPCFGEVYPARNQLASSLRPLFDGTSQKPFVMSLNWQ